MKKRLILCIVLLMAGFVQADGLTYSPPSCGGSNDLLGMLSNLPNCLVDSFFSFIISGLIASLQTFIDSSFKFLFSSPDPNWFCGSYNLIMSVLESLYSIALMGLALMFIVRSNDVEGRVSAKKWLQNFLVMIIFLSFSFQIFQLMLDFNTYLSTSIASESMKSFFTPNADFSSAIFALLMLLFISALLILTFLTLLIRYVLIPFLLLLFPVAIFLYFMPLTQSWGKTFLKVIAIIVFMTSFDAIILLGLTALFNASDPNLADALVRAFAILFGFGALGIINLLLLITAILSVVTQSKAVSGIVGFSLLSKVLKR